MSAHSKTPVQRLTPPDIRAGKGGTPSVWLTCYDAAMAKLFDTRADVLLVGDSLGNVIHGFDNTIPVTLEMMILHAAAVVRGSQRPLVVVDLPFGSYERSREQAFDSAVKALQESGAGAVKLETGEAMAETVAYLVERGVPVVGHVGLRPQAALAEGRFRAKGRDPETRARVLAEAEAVDAAGAFAIVVEGVAEDLADEVTGRVAAPTIGIGASARCDGQVLVSPDMLGLFDWTPRFVKRYADLKGVVETAVERYAEEVRSRAFPGDAEVYKAKKD
ncbi:3-methyl-2-oxobutanoate hydroxymethyltransferase [Leptolyngbya valderiana BDU 20041]|nr:3-methyl-2-oxobutanoate hydroxymethyltransferase [Leptolyngbya valderiana BDU 20041]